MSAVRLMVIVMLLASTAVFARSVRDGDRVVGVNLAELPYAVSAWTGTEAPELNAETVSSLGADAYLNRIYSDGAGVPVGVYIAFYGAQRPGVSVHSPLHCLPGTGWEALDVRSMDIARDGEPPGRLRRMVVRKSRDRAMVLYWYAVHGRMLASEATSKLWLLNDSIRLGRSDAALVRIVVPITGAVDAAERRGIAFTRDLLPYLSKLWS